MGLFHLPSIVTNDLIFCYDMNNTQKSWKGKPTENLYGNAIDYDLGLANGYWTLNDNDTNSIKLSSTFASWCVYWSAALAANTVYTFSCEYKSDVEGSTLYWDNDGVDDNTWNVALSATTEWQKYTFTRTNITAGNMKMYIKRNSGGNIYVKKVQIEQNSFATPFVKGTRSNTQAILDLTNNNTITATSLTYNSDGTFNFDGSNNYITITDNNILTSTTALSIDIWFKSSDIQTRINELIGKGSSDTDEEYVISIYKDWIYFDVGNALGPYIQPTTSLINNTWYNIVGVHNRNAGSSTLIIYLNGIALSANVNLPTNIPNNNSLPVSIGRRFYNSDPYTRTFNGIISLVKIYNRALSAAEVSQNFAAHRGRYGI